MSEELAHIELRMMDAGEADGMPQYKIRQEVKGEGKYFLYGLALLINDGAEIYDIPGVEIIRMLKYLCPSIVEKEAIHIELGEIERAREKMKDERGEGEA